jgi:thioredoxin reductase (NADPH)
LRLFGTRGSSKAYALRDFLQRSDIPFQWNELASDAQATEQAQVANLRDSRLPVCVFPDGPRMECPTMRQ